ncbi:MAG: PAS domain-containing protein [Cellvibrionaceae bacterium]
MVKRVWLTEEGLRSLNVNELRALVARHQRIFDSSSGYGFWEWDMRTHVFDWSGAFWEEIGYGEDDAPSINDARKLPSLIHPDDWASSREAIVRHLKTGAKIDVTFRVLTKAGDYRWSQCLADSVRDENGRAIYLSGINFDITSIKDAEDAASQSDERQQRIISSSNDGIWEWSESGGSLFYSKRCFEQIGLEVTDEDLLRGEYQFERFRERILAEDLPKFEQALKQHLRNEGPFDVEYRTVGGEGRQYWIRTRGQAIFNEDGKAIVFSGTNMDISALKKAEERVIQTKEAAEKANKAKSQFLSNMSHELRTPLNAILGFSQLFDFEKNLSESQQENVKEIRKAGQHLLQLINDVLDLAKIESGNMTLSLEPVLPIRIVEECIGLMQSMADSRRIQITLEGNSLEHVYLHADAIRLKQVILNLLSNAIKYNRDNGAVVIRFAELHKGRITLQVHDTGYGIPDSSRDAVFEPFNRLGAEESGTEGSGVGLVITKQLVEMMGGQLDFYSEIGEGSCFNVSMKLSEEWTADKAQTIDHDFTETQSVDIKVRETKNILYIEDNASNLRLMEQLLQRFSQLELETANEAFRGLFKARTQKPDLIILDINLPGIDGYEALKVLKEDSSTSHIPVIALSANAMTYDIDRGLRAGFEAYLTKPLNFTELINTLNEFLVPDENLIPDID